jgi:T3SS negative regulator,GrlR
MRNGLYSIHVNLLDGNTGKGSGVVVFRDGTILGGDAFLFYTGSYSLQPNNTFKGEVIVNQHTPSRDVNPLFGGRQVSIGVTGKYTDTAADMEGTALVGKNSLFFKATLRKLAEAQ